jgi:hypothetical protein
MLKVSETLLVHVFTEDSAIGTGVKMEYWGIDVEIGLEYETAWTAGVTDKDVQETGLLKAGGSSGYETLASVEMA